MSGSNTYILKRSIQLPDAPSETARSDVPVPIDEDPAAKSDEEGYSAQHEQQGHQLLTPCDAFGGKGW